MNAEKRKFFLVVNNEGDHFEGCYATFEEALKHAKRRKAELEAKNRLHMCSSRAFEIQHDTLTLIDLDYIVEGERTEELWRKAAQ